MWRKRGESAEILIGQDIEDVVLSGAGGAGKKTYAPYYKDTVKSNTSSDANTYLCSAEHRYVLAPYPYFRNTA